MTRDEARGQYALKALLEGHQGLQSRPKYVEPALVWIGSDGKPNERLYELERKRTDLIGDCARQWAIVCGVDKSEYWTRSIPQALHDTLEAFETAAGILAAEAFLKRHGWKVERPALDPGLDEK